MTEFAEGYGYEGTWRSYTPRLLCVGTTGVADPVDPILGNSEVAGAFCRFQRTLAGRFRYRMGSTFMPPSGAGNLQGAYAVELPQRPFYVDDEVHEDRTTPQLVGFGWAVDHAVGGDVVDRYHLFNMVYDPPWRVGNVDSSMAIMFVHDGTFSGNPPGNPLGRFGTPTEVGVPFEFAEDDVLAGVFSYQVAAD